MKKQLLFLTVVIVLLFSSIIVSGNRPTAEIVTAGYLTVEKTSQENPTDYFISIPALAGLVLLITAAIKRKYDLSGYAQYVSWGVSLLLSGIGYVFGFGIFAEVSWYYIFIYGLAAGLIANGLFDWKYIKSILKFFNLYKAPLIGALMIFITACGTYTPPPNSDYGIEETQKIVKATYNTIEETYHVINKDKDPMLIAMDLLPDVFATIEAVNSKEELVNELKTLTDADVAYLAGLGAEYELGEYQTLFESAVKIILYTLKTTFLYNNSPPENSAALHQEIFLLRERYNQITARR